VGKSSGSTSLNLALPPFTGTNETVATVDDRDVVSNRRVSSKRLNEQSLVKAPSPRS
jgi:hypothetical protein